MEDRLKEERRLSFDKVAELYDQYRPEIPFEIFDFMEKVIELRYKKLLEFGCGSGQSTERLLDFHCYITAIDISENMLKVLESKFSQGKYLKIKKRSFEDLGMLERYDVIYCSQTKHWIKTELFYKKAYTLLNDDGYLCWTNYTPIVTNSSLRNSLDEVYKTLFPNYSGKHSPTRNYQEEQKMEAIKTGKFHNLKSIQSRFKKTYNSEEYIHLMKTMSDHIVHEKELTKFYLQLEKIIKSYGNKIEIEYLYDLILAQKI